MSRRETLQDAAGKFVATLEHRAPALRAERLDMRVREAEIEAELATIADAPRRLETFSPEVAGYPQCPHCWITEETRSAMLPAADSVADDLHYCPTCGFHIAIAG